MSSIAQQALKTSDQALSIFRQNPYVSGFVMLFFLAYGGLIAPKLPVEVAVLFDHTLFKVVFLFLLLLVFRQNPTISLLMAVAFVLTMQTLSNYRIVNLTNSISSALNSIKPTDNFADINQVDSPSAPVMTVLPSSNPNTDALPGSASTTLAPVGQEMLANTGADEMPGTKYQGNLPSDQYAEFPNANFNQLDVASSLLQEQQAYLGVQGQQRPSGFSKNEVGNTFGLPTSQL